MKNKTGSLGAELAEQSTSSADVVLDSASSGAETKRCSLKLLHTGVSVTETSLGPVDQFHSLFFSHEFRGEAERTNLELFVFQTLTNWNFGNIKF